MSPSRSRTLKEAAKTRSSPFTVRRSAEALAMLVTPAWFFTSIAPRLRIPVEALLLETNTSNLVSLTALASARSSALTPEAVMAATKQKAIEYEVCSIILFPPTLECGIHVN